tara:strand:- start:2390 stop:2740 length:351 start_codon:yes stop_codon:yes gene_type:complete
MQLVDTYIRQGRILIKENNIEELDNIYTGILEKYNENKAGFDMTYLFQKLFLIACQYGNKDTISWFFTIYKRDMSDINKIAVKHTFVYAKYLINKRKNKELISCYNVLFNKFITEK